MYHIKRKEVRQIKNLWYFILVLGMIGFWGNHFSRAQSTWFHPSPMNSSSTLIDICFNEQEYGWAVGDSGIVWHTQNGGKSWDSQTIENYPVLHALTFTDEKSGWIVGEGGLILRTQNGGQKWLEQECPTSDTFYDVVFLDSLRGWIAGSYYILATLNGGQSWEVKLHSRENVFYGLYFFNPSEGWAVGGSSLFYTKDGGNTWKLSEVPTRSCLYSIFFQDSLHGWVVGDDAAIFYTANRGQSWQEIYSHRPIWLNSVKFCNPYFGCCAGVFYEDSELQGILLWTNDGGATWQEEICASPLYASCFRKPGLVWTVGAGGYIAQLELKAPD